MFLPAKRRQSLILFVIGLIVRLSFIAASGQYHDLQRYELQRAALSRATTGVLGNPYAIPTGPTAHLSPGYPIILAGIYRIFGADERGELVKETVACGVSATVWAMLPIAGAALGLAPEVGFYAGLLGALLPAKPSVETKGDWEAPYNALAVMLVTCLTAWLWRRREFTNRQALLSGLAWGVSMWFASSVLILYGAFALAGYFHARPRQYAKFLLIQIAIVAAMAAPWMIRNKLELGAPIVTRSNFGIEFRLSNNDLASPLERENYERGVHGIYHPLQNEKVAERVRELGEPAFDREATAQAVAWIKGHPRQFLWLTAQRVFYFWFYPASGLPALRAVWLGLLAEGGFWGVSLFLRRHFWAGLPVALLLLVLPLPYYLVHTGLRYRYPLDWAALLFTVYMVMVMRAARSENAVVSIPR